MNKKNAEPFTEKIFVEAARVAQVLFNFCNVHNCIAVSILHVSY